MCDAVGSGDEVVVSKSHGNLRGAVKLYRSSRDYMERYGSPYLGLDQKRFWEQMERCFAQLLTVAEPPKGTAPDEELIPTIDLDPPPPEWPDPAVYLDDDKGNEGMTG